MPRIRKADCCEYREEKKRQGIKKLQKKRETTKSKQVDDLFNDCQENDEDIEERKCDENKRLPSKPPKYVSIAEEMIGKIKPSIDDRIKYIDERHVCCFLEPSEIEKSKCRRKISAARTRHAKPSNKEKERLDVQPSKLKRNKNQGEEEGEATRKEESQQSVPNGDEPKKKKRSRDYIWCPKLKRVKKSMVRFQESELTESDCKDSICSFDSQINLSGLSLTKEENEKIEEMRRSKIQSNENKKE